MSETLYQIFTDIAEFSTYTDRINTFYDYPNGAVQYRKPVYQNAPGILVAGAVDQRLIDNCASMSESERALYYDDTPGALVTKEDLINDDFVFPGPY